MPREKAPVNDVCMYVIEYIFKEYSEFGVQPCKKCDKSGMRLRRDAKEPITNGTFDLFFME